MRLRSINDLPVEILTMIFMSLTCAIDLEHRVWDNVADVPPSWYYVVPASHVCMHWRTIMLATPRLWGWVETKSCRDLSMLPDTLRRSGNSGLYIFVRSPMNAGTRLLHPMQRAQWKRGLDAIVENMSRVVRFELMIMNWEDAQFILDVLRSVKAPLLRFFTCALYHARNTVLPKDIFSSCAPQLRHLYLVDVFPEDWGSPVFRTLESADILPLAAADTNRISRTRQSQGLPTIAEVVQFLEASNMNMLKFMFFALDPSETAIASRCSREIRFISLRLRPSSSEEAFRQLASAVDLSSVILLQLRPVPIVCAVDLFRHLHGLLDMIIFSNLPTDVDQEYGLPNDYAYNVGQWLVRSYDAHGYARSFETEKHDFTRVNGLENACATAFCRVQRLYLSAGQWPQVSASLSRVHLPCLSQLVIRYAVERSFHGDGPGPFRNNINNRSPDEPINMFKLRGAVLRLPSLTELVLHGSADASNTVQHLPLVASADALQSIREHLGLETGSPLQNIRLINIKLADDDASAILSSLTVAHTIETKHVTFFMSDDRSHGTRDWWSTTVFNST